MRGKTTIVCLSAIALALLTAAAVPPRTLAQESLPDKKSLVEDFKFFQLVPGDQGARDVCSLFAVTGAAEFEYAKHGDRKPVRLSEEFCIWAAHEATGVPGEQAMFYMATQGLNTHGLCAQTLMPYSSNGNSKTRPSAEAITSAHELDYRWLAHWIRRWNVKSKMPESEIVEIKRALANGHPVACGLRWPKKLDGSAIMTVPPANQVFDGHSILLVGYNTDSTAPGGGWFTFRNSVGPKWGNGGYGTMAYAYAKAYANDALWLELERPGAEVPIERFEAEDLPILGALRCPNSGQDMNGWGGGMWSNGKQLFCRAERGGQVEIGFEVKIGASYRLRVLGTAAPDYGIVHMLLDGKRVGPRFDLYCGRVSPSGSLELGKFELSSGRHRLRVVAESKNAVSEGYMFGIDAIDLLPAK